MTESRVSGTASSSSDVAERKREPGRPAAVTPPPSPAAARPSGWTGGRITALVIGTLMVLVALGLSGTGTVALWADLSRRDSAGYVATDVHAFSTAGSALATDPVELGDPGVGWLYSTVVLGEVRIRVTAANPGSTTFVGIGPSGDVDRYLTGVSHTVISDFWSDRVEAIEGDGPASAPGSQNFWVASASGTGAQTLTWDPANGSWTVVVMNADGKPGVDVTTDMGATMPSLAGIAVGSLVIGVVFLIGGVVLIVAAVRRSRAPKVRST
jgi:hypothetical protein